MTDEKKYKVGDLAEEIAVSPSELLEFLKEKGIKVASISSRVGEEVRAIVVGNYSAEKKQSEAQRKHKEDKTRKLKELEKRSQPAPSAADERPKTKEKSRAVVKKAEEQTVTAMPLAALAEPPVAEKVADAAPEIISVEPVAETPSRPVEATPEPVNEKAVEPEPQPTEPP
ncbi:MAG: translation initiation factor IF-2 N-terminal domain-containing protein, partial [Rhizobacter sp.]|nr:translation initiation factor IF-2 N-terminal domain-containing protein [Chlorobiales bacterium]